jgi:hypothetical protein
MIISAELAPVFLSCLERYKTIQYTTEWLSVFREEMAVLQKTWGTWKPLKQMTLIYWDEEGVQRSRPYQMWRDPNLFDESHFLGMGTDGFTASFKTPEDETVSVRYIARNQEFRIS